MGRSEPQGLGEEGLEGGGDLAEPRGRHAIALPSAAAHLSCRELGMQDQGSALSSPQKAAKQTGNPSRRAEEPWWAPRQMPCSKWTSR